MDADMFFSGRAGAKDRDMLRYDIIQWVVRMRKRKNGKEVESQDVAARAAEIACRWLRDHGFYIEECLEDNGKGEKLNVWMKLRRADDGSKFTGTSVGFPTWDWGGSCRKEADAWFYVVSWLFLKDVDGPIAVESIASREMSPGWIRDEKEKRLVPKLAFSSLEEFILKASVHPDFQSGDGAFEGVCRRYGEYAPDAEEAMP